MDGPTRPVGFAVGLCLTLAAAHADTETAEWELPGSEHGFWSDAGNWSTADYPDNDSDTSYEVEIAGSDITLDVDATITSLTTFSGASIFGSGDLDIEGIWDWRGGEIGGPGTTRILSDGTIVFDYAGEAILRPGRTLDNFGTVQWNSTGFRLDADSVFNNHNAFTFNAGGTLHPQSPAGPGETPATFNNFASVDIEPTASFVAIGTRFNNAGVVNVQGPELHLTGGGASSGNFHLGPISEFRTHDYTFEPGTTITGQGTLVAAGGTLTLNTDITAPNVRHHTTVTGPGNISVVDTYTWVAGTLQGVGTLEIGSAATLLLTGNDKLLSRDVNALGNTIWTGNNITASFGATFNNVGVFDIRSSRVFTTGTGTAAFKNLGMLKKTESIGLTTFNIPMTNSGSIDIQVGGIHFSAGGTNTGGIQIAQDAGLALNTFTLDAGTSFAGQGTVAFGGTNDTLTVNADIEPPRFTHHSGTIAGPGSISPVLAYLWINGTLGPGSGTLEIGLDATLQFDAGGNRILQRDLNNAGTIQWDGGQLLLGPDTVLRNAGTFDFHGGGSLASGISSRFDNTGTLRTTQSLAGTAYLAVPLNNTGAIDVQAGELSIEIDGTSSGAIHIAAGAELVVGDATFVLEHGTSFTGQGALAADDDLSVLLANADIAPANVLHRGGATVTGPGNISPVHAYEFANGTLAGSGALDIAGSATLRFLSGTSTVRRTINNHATTVWEQGFIAAGAGAVFHNAGLFDIQSNSNFLRLSDETAFFDNTGTLRKTQSTGTTILNLPVDSSGDIEVLTGTLEFRAGGTNTGWIEINPDATFQPGTFTLNPGTGFAGSGTLDVTGENTTLTVNTAVAPPNVRHRGGATIAGPGSINPADTYEFANGTLAGPGTLDISSSATLHFVSGDSLVRRHVNNHGDTLWTASQIRAGDDIAFNNHGTFNIQSNNFFGRIIGDTSSPRFENTGTVTKTVGTGTSSFFIELNSSGSIQVHTGIISLAGGGTNTGNIHVVPGAMLRISSNYTFGPGTTLTGFGPVHITGGTLSVAEPNLNFAQLVIGSSSTLAGPETVRPDHLEWAFGGNITAPVELGPDAVADIDGSTTKSIGGTFTNHGQVNWHNGNLALANDAAIVNAPDGIIEAGHNRSILAQSGQSPAGVSNAGIFHKHAGTGTTAVNVPFDPTGGTVIVSVGIIRLSDLQPADPADPANVTNANTPATTWQVDQGATLTIENSPLTLALNDLLTGAGTVNASDGGVVNDGTIRPGNSTGTLNLNAHYTQQPTGTLEILIAGPTPGDEHDQLAITGSANLAGNLDVTFDPDFTPTPGQSFPILTVTAGIDGSFDHVNLPTLDHGVPVLRHHDYTVTVQIALVGDMNLDGVVDTADVAPFVLALTNPQAYLAQYGVAPTHIGDIDQNGAFDTADVAPFVQLLIASASQSVPEPGSLALLGLGTLVVLRRGRCRRRR